MFYVIVSISFICSYLIEELYHKTIWLVMVDSLLAFEIKLSHFYFGVVLETLDYYYYIFACLFFYAIDFKPIIKNPV